MSKKTQNITLNYVTVSGQPTKFLLSASSGGSDGSVASIGDARYVLTSSLVEQRIQSNIVLSGTVKVSDTIANYAQHLILSSSAGSIVRVSGGIKIADAVGSDYSIDASSPINTSTSYRLLSNIVIRQTGNNTAYTAPLGHIIFEPGNTPVFQMLSSPAGTINNSVSHLILSSTAGSIIAASSTLYFPNADKSYHINAPNSHLILNSDIGITAVSGNLKVLSVAFIPKLRGWQNSAVDRINMETSDSIFYRYDSADVTINETMRFASGSRHGYQSLFSGSIVFGGVGRILSHVASDNSHLILSSSAGSVIAMSSSVAFPNVDRPYHINSLNSHLILSSSAGSYVTVSGGFQILSTATNPFVVMSGTKARITTTQYGVQSWALNSTVAEVGYIGYGTPFGTPGIVFQDANGFQRSDFRHLQSNASGGFVWSAHSASTAPPTIDMCLTKGILILGSTFPYDPLDKIRVSASINNPVRIVVDNTDMSSNAKAAFATRISSSITSWYEHENSTGVTVLNAHIGILSLKSTNVEKIRISSSVTFSASQDFYNSTDKYHINAKNSHLILSSSSDATVTVSGTLLVTGSIGVRVAAPTKPLQVDMEEIEFPIFVRAYGPTNTNRTTLLTQRALGTIASPSGVTTSTVLGGLSMGGRDSAGTMTDGDNGGAEILAVATEPFTTVGRGTRVDIYVTASSSLAETAALIVDAGRNRYAGTFTNAGGNTDRYGLKVVAGSNADGGGSPVYYLWASTGNDSANVGYIENTGGGTFQLVTVSDARTKTNIAPTELSGSDIILSMQPRQYHKRGHFHRIGFVAQEVESLYPEAISTDPEGQKGIAYSALIPILIKAMQEQHQKISELQQRIEILEGG